MLGAKRAVAGSTDMPQTGSFAYGLFRFDLGSSVRLLALACRQGINLPIVGRSSEALVHEIGAAASASGVTAKMIRHYEAIGLLPPAQRRQNAYRDYGEREVHELRFIKPGAAARLFDGRDRRASRAVARPRPSQPRGAGGSPRRMSPNSRRASPKCRRWRRRSPRWCRVLRRRPARLSDPRGFGGRRGRWRRLDPCDGNATVD